MKLSGIVSALVLLVTAAGFGTVASAADRETGRGTGPIIYVTSQGLYYDSIALADVPNKGNFQQLIPGQNGLETEFGPGSPGHLGGRWWLDLNGDGIQNEGDKFFLCPLLGPGRETP